MQKKQKDIRKIMMKVDELVHSEIIAMANYGDSFIRCGTKITRLLQEKL